jgi:hypothetical protein
MLRAAIEGDFSSPLSPPERAVPYGEKRTDCVAVNCLVTLPSYLI